MKIEKVVFGGYGIGYQNENTYFVSGALPGEDVEVEIIHRRKGIFIGKIKDIKKKSPARMEPICKVENLCGGCIWSGVKYSFQVEIKKAILKDIFKKSILVTPSIPQNNYRNKIILPVSPNGEIGIYQSRSHNVVPIDECLLHPKIFKVILEILENYIKKSQIRPYNEHLNTGNLKHVGIRVSNKSEILIILVTKTRKIPFSKVLLKTAKKNLPKLKGIVQNINSKSTNKIFGDDQKIIYGQDYLIENIGDKKYKCSYQSFFQINHFQIKPLYDYIKSISPENAIVIDAYSGVGSIGIYLSKKVQKVYCIEENPSAVKNAKYNRKINMTENIEIIAGKVEKYLKQIKDSNLLILDPPRSGLSKDMTKSIVAAKIKKIIYVSCNPTTQKRDIDILKTRGYFVKSLMGFDMFPHTSHIECVAELVSLTISIL